jgi:uncharacterized protein
VTRICNGGFAEWFEREADCDRRLRCDKIEWTEAEGLPLHGTYVGPQAVVDGVFMRTGEIGNDSTVTPTRFIAGDDTVVATGTDSWKHRSTGKPAEVQMAHVWTFRDGKVISMQQHVDTLKVQELSA